MPVCEEERWHFRPPNGVSKDVGVGKSKVIANLAKNNELS